MIEYELTNGMFALIDNEDLEKVSALGKWYADIHGHGKRIYVYKRINKKKVYLHKFILHYFGQLDIDHKDGNGLNCQKENLILKDRTYNNLNNHNIRSDNVSGYAGVYWDSWHYRWKTEIRIYGKKFYLGSFLDKDAAVSARKEAMEKVSRGLTPK